MCVCVCVCVCVCALEKENCKPLKVDVDFDLAYRMSMSGTRRYSCEKKQLMKCFVRGVMYRGYDIRHQSDDIHMKIQTMLPPKKIYRALT